MLFNSTASVVGRETQRRRSELENFFRVKLRSNFSSKIMGVLLTISKVPSYPGRPLLRLPTNSRSHYSKRAFDKASKSYNYQCYSTQSLRSLVRRNNDGVLKRELFSVEKEKWVQIYFVLLTILKMPSYPGRPLLRLLTNSRSHHPKRAFDKASNSYNYQCYSIQSLRSLVGRRKDGVLNLKIFSGGKKNQ